MGALLGRMRSIVDFRSLFVRIGLVVAAAGFLMSAGLAYLYYQQSTTRGFQDAIDQQSEVLTMLSAQVAQDVSRNVTRRLTVTLEGLSDRTGDVFVQAAVYNKEGEVMVTQPSDLPPPDIAEMATYFGQISETMTNVVLPERQTVLSPVIMPNGSLAGYTVLVWDQDVIRAPILDRSLLSAGILAAAFVAWTGVIILLLRRLVGRPLGVLGSALSDLENGQFDLATHDMGQVTQMMEIQDRLISLSTTLAEAEQANLEKERDRAEKSRAIGELTIGLEALAARNLGSPIETVFSDHYEILRTNFNTAQAAVAATLQDIAGSFETFGLDISRLVEMSGDLSQRSVHQATTVSSILTSLHDAAEHTKSAVDLSKGVEAKVVETNQTVERSGAIVASAVTAMSEVEHSSAEIEKIVGVIEDIAFQTNLLALNAAVEASRAGEAGKGFMVVASEVRNLSTRTAEAAKEIRGLITESVGRMKDGAGRVRDVGATLEQAVEGVRIIDREVNSMVSAFVEHSQALEAINTGAKDLDNASRESASMAEAMKGSTDRLEAQSEELRNAVGTFALPGEGQRPPQITQEHAA